MTDADALPVEKKKKSGRRPGQKNVKMEFVRYYAIKFHYKGYLYIYCHPQGAAKPTFVPLELVKHQDLEKLNILKYATNLEACDVMEAMEEFEIHGTEIEPEIVCNDDIYFYELAEPVYLPNEE